MKLFDVNVLIYAHRQDLPQHEQARRWWEDQVNLPESFGMAELVLSSFLRIVTNPRAFETPTPVAQALQVVADIRSRGNHVAVRPGPRHFDIFTGLCQAGNAKGKLIADAYLAALAVEHGCRWASYDRDFARFPGLTWIDPAESTG